MIRLFSSHQCQHFKWLMTRVEFLFSPFLWQDEKLHLSQVILKISREWRMSWRRWTNKIASKIQNIVKKNPKSFHTHGFNTTFDASGNSSEEKRDYVLIARRLVPNVMDHVFVHSILRSKKKAWKSF